MLDVIIRALRHPLDYILVMNRRGLVLEEVKKEIGDIYSFIFRMPDPFDWKAGQHGIFLFPDKKIEGKSWRAFSIASSSSEQVVRISTIIKENPSDFKKNLLLMKQGDKLTMHGPFGEFHTSPRISHIVGIAGGIGITPFRALITDIARGIIANTQLTLIYSALGQHPFKEEFDALAGHPAIQIIYTSTPPEVNAALDEQIQKAGNGASYFISGPPGMITAIREKCKNAGITHIVNDTFKGY